MSTDVKVYMSTFSGAPTLTGQAGQLIALLDAILVNGYGLSTVDSITIEDEVATVVRSGGHPFTMIDGKVGMVAEIAGASVSGGSINGQHRVRSVVSGTTWTFDAPGFEDQVATGTITQKVAPAGWEKAFSGTNLAAYRSLNPESTQKYVRIDDTTTQSSRMRGYSTMTDVNTGTYEFPPNATVSGGLFVSKSSAGDSTTRPWIVVADDRTVYLKITLILSISHARNTIGFGDLIPFREPDENAFFVLASETNYTGYAASNGAVELMNGSSRNGLWLSRPINGVGAPQGGIRNASPIFGSSLSPLSGECNLVFPNPADGALILSRISVSEAFISSFGCLRGLLPGVYFCPQALGGAFVDGQVIEDLEAFPDISMMASATGSSGALFYDITGPWS